jgi:predicted phage terminase large subunit-like protein
MAFNYVKDGSMDIINELAMIKDYQIMMSRENFMDYVELVNIDWILMEYLKFVLPKVQDFIEDKGDYAGKEILILSIPPQHGKACKLSTPILTDNGWKKHGELQVGDYVYHPSGKPIKVLANIPQTEPCTLEVELSNGEKIKVHPNHEWTVMDRTWKEFRTLETKALVDNLISEGVRGKRGVRYRYQLPFRGRLEFEEQDLEIDPYYLGAWLGDGAKGAHYIYEGANDTEVGEALSKIYDITKVTRHKTTGVKLIQFSKQNIVDNLKVLGVHNNKHIPLKYIFNSEENRLKLLAGLIDTDGSLSSKTGQSRFINTNKRLIEDVELLLMSLGYTYSVTKAATKRTDRKIKDVQDCYTIGFTPHDKIPCKVSRKQSDFVKMQRKVSIKNIIPCEPVDGNCITVDSPDGLYLVGKKMVPTHNSMSITETLPGWYIGKYPGKRVLIVSYGDDLARKFGRKNKQKIAEWNGPIFGDKIDKSKRSDVSFEVNSEDGKISEVRSMSIMGGITGKAGELIIIDDPIKNRENADSPTQRDKIWEEFMSSIYTRLQATGKIILIQTRWHEDDLAGRIIKSGRYDLSVINIPCEAELDDPLGRIPGQPLAPEIGKGVAWLKKTKRAYLEGSNEDVGEFGSGQRAWYSLYQGNPTIESGNIIKAEWWKYYENDPITVDEELISVDAAFKDKDDSDFVCIQVWAKYGVRIYLLDNLKSRMGFVETCKAIKVMRNKHPRAKLTLVEDKANGSAIIDVLSREVMGIIPVEPKGGKIARMKANTYVIESGNVYLPKYASWLKDFLEECKAFPRGANDDQIDAMSQALNRLTRTPAVKHPLDEYGDGFYTPFEKDQREAEVFSSTIHKPKNKVYQEENEKESVSYVTRRYR